jgi:hypothetical protein
VVQTVDVLHVVWVPTNALLGIFYVRKPGGVKWDSYYNTLRALNPLFESEDLRVVIGFYLNICDNFDAVRISYFVDRLDIEASIDVFRKFFRSNRLVEIQTNAYPRNLVLASNYGGKHLEARFRNFLALETKIGLELINRDLLHARILFATYRWQVRKASMPVRAHFEPAFKRHSPTYNGLSGLEKDQFFLDLQEWPNPPQVDWAHMMVNLVLGCDWNNVFGDPNYITPGKPMSIPEINAKVKGLGFQIPLDWTP